MGQKVNPKIIRIGITQTWGSKWFSNKEYIPRLRQDVGIRKFLMKKLREAGISRVEIERGPAKLTINLFVAKPGIVIGRNGAGIEELKKELHATILNKKKFHVPGKIDVSLNVMEIDNPSLHSQLVMDSMIIELEKRVPYRRVLKQALQRVEKAGAKGVKLLVAGRLNGADIARTEHVSSGRLPLHTFRADIDYSRGAARTIYGQIGVKVWIYKGEVFNKEDKSKTTKENKEIKTK